tara:strand:- start:192 stop:479 length:288 start_codon:yes stop_codon:yes gene_type:complete
LAFTGFTSPTKNTLVVGFGENYPLVYLKKKRGKRMTKKLSPAEEYELNFLRKQVDHYETKVFELERHKDIARDHERAREELKSYVLKLRGLGREV